MATPGISDPYFYEWYVGLMKIIEMLNPDSQIDYVIFQCEEYDTIDDVVVHYKDGIKQLCYQIKHEISTSKSNNLTFSNILEKRENKPSLFVSMFNGWKKAKELDNYSNIPILYTNRIITGRGSTRTINGIKYSYYSIDRFISLIQQEINKYEETNTFNINDQNLSKQWDEFRKKQMKLNSTN